MADRWDGCDECGTGGGGLCPVCKDGAMKVKRSDARA